MRAGSIMVGLGLAAAGFAPWGAILCRACTAPLGTVAAAGLGAWAAGAGIPVFWHLAAAGLVVAGSVTTAARWFRADVTPVGPAAAYRPDTFEDPSTGPIPVIGPGTEDAPLDNKRKIAQAWRDRRTLLLGVMVLSLAVAEGAAGDWVALAFADGHDQSDAAGAAGYGIFVTFMTIGRFAGTMVLDRFGRAPSCAVLHCWVCWPSTSGSCIRCWPLWRCSW